MRKRLSRRLSSLFDTKKNVPFSLPNISQVIRVNIDNFHFNRLVNGHRQLMIQSHRAFFAAENTDQLTLRGAVKISTPDGMIQSNHIVWNTQTQIFHVKGSYVLTTQNSKQFGQNVCFDADLNILSNATKTTKKGGSLCHVTNLR